MRFDADTRSQVYADMTLDFDPTGSTVEVEIDGTWYPATWQGDPEETTTGHWTQTALTTSYFAGPEATPSGAVVLALGRHPTQTRVTSGGTILAEDSTPIDVR